MYHHTHDGPSVVLVGVSYNGGGLQICCIILSYIESKTSVIIANLLTLVNNGNEYSHCVQCSYTSCCNCSNESVLHDVN